MLRSSAIGTLGEQGLQSDCISFGAGGRGLDQAISLRMRPRSLAALTRAAISGSTGSVATMIDRGSDFRASNDVTRSVVKTGTLNARGLGASWYVRRTAVSESPEELLVAAE